MSGSWRNRYTVIGLGNGQWAVRDRKASRLATVEDGTQAVCFRRKREAQERCNELNRRARGSHD